ncbi:hypothetical protein C8T65DRAFT_669692, partial [Cerioporus squamosus]
MTGAAMTASRDTVDVARRTLRRGLPMNEASLAGVTGVLGGERRMPIMVARRGIGILIHVVMRRG